MGADRTEDYWSLQKSLAEFLTSPTHLNLAKLCLEADISPEEGEHMFALIRLARCALSWGQVYGDDSDPMFQGFKESLEFLRGFETSGS